MFEDPHPTSESRRGVFPRHMGRNTGVASRGQEVGLLLMPAWNGCCMKPSQDGGSRKSNSFALGLQNKVYKTNDKFKKKSTATNYENQQYQHNSNNAKNVSKAHLRRGKVDTWQINTGRATWVLKLGQTPVPHVIGGPSAAIRPIINIF